MQTVAIIGGGAAGMMAAATIIEECHRQQRTDIRVYLFEKNTNLGAKVLISGGGRCNITTSLYRRKDLESKYVRGADRLRHAIGNFGPRKIYQWFEDNGVGLKIEADGRVFPVSDRGADVVGVFERLFAQSDIVTVHYQSSIQDIHRQDDGRFVLTSNQNSTFGIGDGSKLSASVLCDVVIVATGGQAYRQTGSTGDAYGWLERLGHTITPLGPSLNSFLTKEKVLHTLSGLSFASARITVPCLSPRERVFSGAVLLTHFGLSGPLIFVIAAHCAFQTIDDSHPLEILFAPEGDSDRQCRNQRLLSDAEQFPRKQVSTILAMYLPVRYVDMVLSQYVDQELPAIGLLTKAQRLYLAHLLGDGIPVYIVGRRPGDEFVTAGGVLLDEIDPKTMMSHVVPNLYVVGEVLDVDGVTGGYNLTASRATGKLAGEKSM